MNTTAGNSSIGNFKPRLKAAGIHLGASATMALVLVLLVTNVWYPTPLFKLANGRDIFLLLIACDVTLGPVMTLIIFNIRKPRAELIRDVIVIAAVQIAAMIYGVSTLLQVRPAYIVYNSGQFNVPLANELLDEDFKALAGSSVAPWFGPKLVGSRIPTDGKERDRILFGSVDGKGDIFQMPRYFVPYDEIKSELIARLRNVDQMAGALHLSAPELKSRISQYEKNGVTIGLAPLVIRHATAVAVVDSHSGALLGIEELPEH
jgi:hypothetical protein